MVGGKIIPQPPVTRLHNAVEQAQDLHLCFISFLARSHREHILNVARNSLSSQVTTAWVIMRFTQIAEFCTRVRVRQVGHHIALVESGREANQNSPYNDFIFIVILSSTCVLMKK